MWLMGDENVKWYYKQKEKDMQRQTITLFYSAWNDSTADTLSWDKTWPQFVPVLDSKKYYNCSLIYIME